MRAYIDPFDLPEDPSTPSVATAVAPPDPNVTWGMSPPSSPQQPMPHHDAEGNDPVYVEDAPPPATPAEAVIPPAVPPGPVPVPEAPLSAPVPPPPTPMGPPKHMSSFSGGAADEMGAYTDYRFGPGAPVVGAPPPAGVPVSGGNSKALSEEEMLRAMRMGMGR